MQFAWLGNRAEAILSLFLLPRSVRFTRQIGTAVFASYRSPTSHRSNRSETERSFLLARGPSPFMRMIVPKWTHGRVGQGQTHGSCPVRERPPGIGFGSNRH